MWKAATKTIVLAVSLATFGTGCDLADLADAIGASRTTVGEIPGDPAPPTDPGEPDVPMTDCEAELDACLAGYDDADVMPMDGTEPMFYGGDCFELYDICIDDTIEPPVEPPPMDDCEAELEQCLGNGFTNDLPLVDGTMPVYEGDCFEMYDICIDDSLPPPPPMDDCEVILDECLNNLYNGDEPFSNGPADMMWMPYPGEEACFEAFSVCIDDYLPPPPPMDGCDELFDMCLMNGVSTGLCEQVYDECVTNDHPCDDGDTEPGYPGDEALSEPPYVTFP